MLAPKERKSLGLQRVAVIILALGSVLAASLFSVDAFRVKVLNFFMETKPEYTEFRLEESKERRNDEKVVDWSNSYMPTYVPEGYTVEFSENGSAIKSILFQNAEGKIIDYTQHTEAANFNYDTESASSREITVNEKGGTLIVKEGTYSIVWKYEKSIFVVMTQIDEQETLKIAENIKFMK
mgnify:CR=1 FL=1